MHQSGCRYASVSAVCPHLDYVIPDEPGSVKPQLVCAEFTPSHALRYFARDDPGVSPLAADAGGPVQWQNAADLIARLKVDVV